MRKKPNSPILEADGQLRWPFGVNGSGRSSARRRRLVIPFYSQTGIPIEAALHVFTDVFSQYMALVESIESDTLSIEARDFMIDVESQIQQLYGNGEEYRHVMKALALQGRSFRTTRAALGEAFLLVSLWPTKNYFCQRG